MGAGGHSRTARPGADGARPGSVWGGDNFVAGTQVVGLKTGIARCRMGRLLP